MDKTWKLHRYNRKDYTEVVDFPVEIVGRDGVVRRYTFEDSIRLYQRRITFAPIRYRDNDLVDAEVLHCRSRIDQLRRSYFHRFGWGTAEGQPDVEAIFGELAGELAAFVCRVLHSPGRPAIQFEQVQSERQGASTWYITPEYAESGMLLYVHRFSTEHDDPARDTFFARLKALETIGACEGDGERLLAFHHTVDCGFVLTGQGSEFQSLLPRAGEEGSGVDLSPTPWDEVLDLIRRGAHEIALARCRAITEEQPWHQRAYLAGALLAVAIGEHSVAEEIALVGGRYFKEDGVLRSYLGLARLRLDRVEEGEAALKEALELSPQLASARLSLVASLLTRRAFREAYRLLRERPSSMDSRSEAYLARLQDWLGYRRVVLWGGGTLALTGVVATTVTWLGLLPLLCGLGAMFAGTSAFDRQVGGITLRRHEEEVRRGLRHLTRRRETAQVVS